MALAPFAWHWARAIQTNLSRPGSPRPYIPADSPGKTASQKHRQWSASGGAAIC